MIGEFRRSNGFPPIFGLCELPEFSVIRRRPVCAGTVFLGGGGGLRVKFTVLRADFNRKFK
jgi:hypothetical protein